MHWIPLVLALGAAQDVWVSASPAITPCEATSFAHALHVLRPALLLHDGHSRAPTSLSVTLERAGSAYQVRLVGPSLSVVRTFTERNDCEATSWTGALLVDGALNELAFPTETPTLGELGGPSPKTRPSLAVLVGSGVEQGLLGATPPLSLALRFTRGLVQAGVGGEWTPQQSATRTVSGAILGEYPNGVAGTFVTSQLAAELSTGVGWHLGPGRLSGEGVLGIAVVDAHLDAPELFQHAGATLTVAFGGLRTAYTFDLPARLRVAIGFEERWAPDQTALTVEGAQARLTTREWTAIGMLALGWRFF